MLNLLKLFSLALFMFTSLQLEWTAEPGITVVLVLVLILMAAKSNMSFLSLCRRNIFILVFTVTFSLISLFSQYITAGIKPYATIVTAVKIILVFNIILFGSIWMGKNGFLFFLNLCTSLRLKIYLLLLYNTVAGFMKRNRILLYQLKTRINPKGKNFLLFLRYYLVNFLTIDLYSIHLNQGALLSRLHGNFTVYNRKPDYTVLDILIILLSIATGLYALGAALRMVPGV